MGRKSWSTIENPSQWALEHEDYSSSRGSVYEGPDERDDWPVHRRLFQR